MTARAVPEAPEVPEAEDAAELRRLLGAIYDVYHHDFRSYALVPIRRRIQTALSHFRCEAISELHDRVVRDPAVFAALLRFLTVQVSEMFRDPLYFRAIREQVIPYLKSYAAPKLWVAGCATGEEAYSLAIVLLEDDLLDRTRICATDIHPDSLRAAHAGVYVAERFARFSDNYRRAGGRGSLSDGDRAVLRPGRRVHRTRSRGADLPEAMT